MTIAKCTKTAASSNVSNHLSRTPAAWCASGAAHHARPYRNLGRRISLRSYTIVDLMLGLLPVSPITGQANSEKEATLTKQANDFRGRIFSREDIFARGYFREKIFSRDDIFAGRYFRVNSKFAKISSRENISNSLFAKFSSRENKVLYSSTSAVLRPRRNPLCPG